MEISIRTTKLRSTSRSYTVVNTIILVSGKGKLWAAVPPEFKSLSDHMPAETQPLYDQCDEDDSPAQKAQRRMVHELAL